MKGSTKYSRVAGYREINIAAGTLERSIENVAATLVHEMTHQYNNEVANVQDCSRGGVDVPGLTGRSGSRRWTCPGCGAIVHSMKRIDLICGDCARSFIAS